MAVLAYIKFMKSTKTKSLFQILITLLAFSFCTLILLFNSDPFNFSAVITMLLFGITVYMKVKKNGTLSV